MLDEGIYNFSNVELNENKIKVLDSGLQYAPQCNNNKFNVYMDLQEYIRKLNNKKYFIINASM